MDCPLIPDLPVHWDWFCDNAELFSKVDKKTSKEISEKNDCELKACYHNTWKSDIRGKYRYFEGHVNSQRLPLMTAHSWLVDSKGNVIDPTLIIDVKIDGKEMKNRCGDYYIGIEIPRDWLNKTVRKLLRADSTLFEYYNYKEEKTDEE